MYINAAQCISPQHAFGNNSLLLDLVQPDGHRHTAMLPDHKDLIDPKQARRMSRIIKMGVMAGLACLREAEIQIPDVIITGTAFGCMEDTGTFLHKMVQQQEELLTPTSFIQSTHNTVGAQIALLLGCHGYNNTFVNGGASFEHALLDAMMLLSDREASNVFVGGIDEITNDSYAILKRFGLYKHAAAGEGAAFFALSSDASANALCRMVAVQTYYKPDGAGEMVSHVDGFLADTGLSSADIDLVINGKSGDHKFDTVIDQVLSSTLSDVPSVSYKHLCGEYPTASSFAVWLGTDILKAQQVPPSVGKFPPDKKLSNVLVYNNYLNVHHSLILLSAC